jgi:hypothetical protein
MSKRDPGLGGRLQADGWRQPSATVSLPEVHGSVPIPLTGGFWRKLLAFAGPGYLVAVGYMDPGNWATDLAGGSRYGYTLLSKTIQTFARWDALRQGDALPVSISVTGSYEGLNNLRERRQPGVAVTVSRTFGDRLALYATPGFVADTHAVDFIAGHEDHDDLGLEEDEHSTHNDTWFAGIGGRLRFSHTGYITGEYTPRLHGYDPNRGEWGVGVEKRTGGHTLQLNITNSFGTTFGQLARGGSPHDIYLGFNITRRF